MYLADAKIEANQAVGLDLMLIILWQLLILKADQASKPAACLLCLVSSLYLLLAGHIEADEAS